MTQTVFSAGRMFAYDLTTGPEEFGLLQNVSIDFTRDVKELFGEHQFPAVVATGMSRITGRAAHGRIFGSLYANAFFGESVVTGGILVADNEAHTVPASPTYTVLSDHTSNWTDDLGVYLTATGARLNYTTGSPASGEYSISLGTYTFNAAQASAAVKINYLYTAGSGKEFTINNQLMGVTPSFKMVLFNPGRTQRGSSPFSLVLNACTSTKLTLPTRLGEFALPEFDFTGYADASDVIGYMSTTE